MALADDGKLELDAPLITYLPEMHPSPGGATLRQAMANTSGIRDHLELWYIAGGGLQVPHSLRDSLALAMRQSATNFEPGARYLYSNAHFLLLSRIAEIAAGEPLETFLERRFFAPLGMTRTALRAGHHDVIEGLATGYVVKADGLLERGKMTAELWGEGSAHSCLEDLARWMQYYREDPDALIARMREPVKFNNGETGFYGLGLFADSWAGGRRVGHYGLWPGYLSEILWYDEADIGLICLSNCNAVEPALINKQLAQKLIPELSPEPSGTADSDLWAAVCASAPWINADTYDVADFAEDAKGIPQFVYYGGEVPLKAASGHVLKLDNGRSEYRSVDIARARHGEITLELANGKTLPLQPACALENQSGSGSFESRWFSSDTQSVMEIHLEDGAPKVKTPAYKGHYWIASILDGGTMKIEENTGPWPRCFYLRLEQRDRLALSGPRVRRIIFQRQ
jgi:CubicO group peptidase (beta-lactamase class C family)